MVMEQEPRVTKLLLPTIPNSLVSGERRITIILRPGEVVIRVKVLFESRKAPIDRKGYGDGASYQGRYTGYGDRRIDMQSRGPQQQQLRNDEGDQLLQDPNKLMLHAFKGVRRSPVAGTVNKVGSDGTGASSSKVRKTLLFDKRWVGQEGLMESISRGWNSKRGRGGVDIVDKIHHCRHEISAWRKAHPAHGKEKINTLQRALEEIQNDFTKTNDEVLEVSRKLQEAYRDEEQY